MLLCFTDLDGTLLNHDDYRYDAAIPTIKKLQAAGIPVIPTTSKTKAEVIELRQALGLKDPFITENGSGIFLEAGDDRFNFGELEPSSGYPLRITQTQGLECITLGLSYEEARFGLHQLAAQLGEPLQGFGDLSPTELQELTQLPPQDIRQACDRQFSEPFVKPQASIEQVETIAQDLGFKILVGNRFCHLLGLGAAKGRAVNIIKQAWQLAHGATESIITIGLGDSPNDLSMLEMVDQAIVIPGVNGPHPTLKPWIENHNWQVAPQTGAQGWSMMVEQCLALVS